MCHIEEHDISLIDGKVLIIFVNVALTYILGLNNSRLREGEACLEKEAA